MEQPHHFSRFTISPVLSARLFSSWRSPLSRSISQSSSCGLSGVDVAAALPDQSTRRLRELHLGRGALVVVFGGGNQGLARVVLPVVEIAAGVGGDLRQQPRARLVIPGVGTLQADVGAEPGRIAGDGPPCQARDRATPSAPVPGRPRH